MAVSQSTVWECRASTGSDTNGGGFKAGASGTDYSQQDAANSGSNDKSTADAVANGTTTITSATANFQTSIVGNIIYLQGGSGSLAAGWYEVTARTNTTTITVDRNVAAGTGITMNIGGALANVRVAMAAANTQNIFWCKGTFTHTTGWTISLSDATPLRIYGYGTTRGDTGRATITTATNSVDLITIAANVYNVNFRNIIFSNTATTRGRGISASNSGAAYAIVFENCRLTGFTNGIHGPYSTQYYFDNLLMLNCEVDNCTGKGIHNTGGTRLSGCSIHNNGSSGLYVDNTLGSNCGVYVVNSSFWANTNYGIYSAQKNLLIVNCVIVDNTSHGLYIQTPNIALLMQNSIFYNNGGYGAYGSYPAVDGMAANAYGANTSGARFLITAAADDVTLTANPFTDKSTGNFSLNSTAGGGAALKAVGFQNTLND